MVSHEGIFIIFTHSLQTLDNGYMVRFASTEIEDAFVSVFKGEQRFFSVSSRSNSDLRHD